MSNEKFSGDKEPAKGGVIEQRTNAPKFDFERSSKGGEKGMTDDDYEQIRDVMFQSEHIDGVDGDGDETGYDWVFFTEKRNVLFVNFTAKSRFYLSLLDHDGVKFWDNLRFENVEDINRISRLFISRVVKNIGIPIEIPDTWADGSIAESDQYEVGDLQTMPQRLEGTFKAVEDAIQEMCATQAEWLKDTAGPYIDERETEGETTSSTSNK